MRRKHVLLVLVLFPAISIPGLYMVFGFTGFIVGVMLSVVLGLTVRHDYLRWRRVKILELIERQSDGFTGKEIDLLLDLAEPFEVLDQLVEGGYIAYIRHGAVGVMLDGKERKLSMYRCILTEKGRQELDRQYAL